ncbi:MAG: D-alanyl-D-alanine carboxypeptidase/D-alanyl-D-alanine-endopeptidase [Bacteroidota bacterium]
MGTHFLKYFFISAFFFLLCNPLSLAQKKTDSAIIKLNAEIAKLNKDPLMKKARWGICVLTADSGTVVAEFHADSGCIPASTMKAINTAAALSMLGKDYIFKTYLFYDGDIDTAGVLHGNIYIKGGGDPSLGSPRIDSMNDIKYLLPDWVKRVQKLGIKKIEGAVIGDASIFDDTIAPAAWLYGDLGNYYGAGASGLSFHENAFRIILKSGKYYKDSARVAELDPPIPYIKIKNKVYTGTAYTAEDTWIYGGPYDNTRKVTGWIPYNKKEYPQRASIPDPSFFCAYSLFKILKDSGIAVSDSCTTLKMLKESGKLKKSRSLTVFHTLKSLPLDTIIYYTNQYSLNSWAENILKILAYEKTGTGSTYNGAQLVTNFWKSKGVDLKGFDMKDGSGLSQSNVVSPRHLASIMRAFMDDSLFDVFYNTLPLAGRTGTISTIFKGTVAENNLRAKSGYMRGMRSYTGYVKNKNNRILTFGIIVNGHSFTADKMRSMLEKIMVLIAETNI